MLQLAVASCSLPCTLQKAHTALLGCHSAVQVAEGYPRLKKENKAVVYRVKVTAA